MRQATATDRYTMVNEGQMSKNEFVRQMRLEFPQFVTQWNGYDDSIQILKNKGMIFETGVNAYDQRQELNLSLDAIDRGTRYECEKANLDAETCDKAEFEKCKQTAITNLKKNPLHYIDLISGESNKVNKHDRETEVKRGEAATDTLNGMKKAELREDAAPTKKRMVKESTADGLRAIKAKYGTIPGFANIFTDFMNMHGEDIAAGADPEDEFEQFIMANSNLDEEYEPGSIAPEDLYYSDKHGKIVAIDDVDDKYHDSLELVYKKGDKIEGPMDEKKGKDLDGDGDIDGDDYKHAKDKAIKKAMGKKSNVNEAVKNIITKILEEQNINEAATNDLAKIAAEYGDFEGLKPAVIALENVVTEIESFYDKTRSKIQKIYNDLGEIRNEEGLKVGAFIAPSIENAFVRDLRPITKQQFHGGLDMPKVKRISQDDIDRGYTQMESPKETVFTPVNEKK